MKTITDNQRIGETLVKAAVPRLGHVFERRRRLETGVDGAIEFRDPATGKMLGKTVAGISQDEGWRNLFARGRRWI
jgi:hypothetical protein